ncbi:hypothetical protein LXL04_025391 [Taraxacum kok-saghyz]
MLELQQLFPPQYNQVHHMLLKPPRHTLLQKESNGVRLNMIHSSTHFSFANTTFISEIFDNFRHSRRPSVHINPESRKAKDRLMIRLPLRFSIGFGQKQRLHHPIEDAFRVALPRYDADSHPMIIASKCFAQQKLRWTRVEGEQRKGQTAAEGKEEVERERERERERESRSFENSYIPENPRTPKPLTFSKNRLRGAKNRSNISPVAKKISEKTTFFFQKLCICANFFFCAYVHRFRSRFFERNNGLGDIGNWGSSRVLGNI